MRILNCVDFMGLSNKPLQLSCFCCFSVLWCLQMECCGWGWQTIGCSTSVPAGTSVCGISTSSFISGPLLETTSNACVWQDVKEKPQDYSLWGTTAGIIYIIETTSNNISRTRSLARYIKWFCHSIVNSLETILFIVIFTVIFQIEHTFSYFFWKSKQYTFKKLL